VKQCRASYFTIQPSEGGERMAEQLQIMGYRPAPGLGHTPATTLVDLTQDLERILQRMHKSSRRAVRIGQRSGLSMREGCEPDVELFHRLLVDASRRLNFDIHPLGFFRHLWQVGAPQGQVRLFFVELAGETLATEVSLAIGDTLYGFKGAWSGTHEKTHPNAFLTWEILRWAKARGFRRYDFVGIDSTPDIAFKLATGEIPREQIHQMYNFKLGFGGDVIFSPIAYEYLPNPALRYLYDGIWRNERLGWLKHKASLLLRGMQHVA
jgi:lipid II:glycine glycyltransferase (peptidoglycan interpeptide bridge formation enzyme)